MNESTTVCATIEDTDVWHSDPHKNAALRAYVECGTVAGASRAAQISRQTFYNWIESDPEFGRALIDCRTALADEMEEEAIRRAKQGSDALLAFLLRAHRPDRYRDKHVIEVVSPEVQSRLVKQADAIEEVCNRELNPSVATVFISKLVNRLREVWV